MRNTSRRAGLPLTASLVASVARVQARRKFEIGIAFCLISALAFSAMTIFGKLAYASGVGVLTLLSVRFSLAAAALGAIAAADHRSAGPATAGRRVYVGAFLVGALIYALQSGALFTAITRIDISLAVLLLYGYPALVTVGAAALGREPLTGPGTLALVLASAGVSLVLLAGGVGRGELAGVALGLFAAAGYAIYVLATEALLQHGRPLALSAVVCAGAGTSFTVVGLIAGALAMPTGEGLAWIGAITLISTVVAISTLFAGLQRVGPSTASIVSTIEPVLAVALAYAVFGDRLTPMQFVGASLVFAALLVLQTRWRRGADQDLEGDA